MARLLLGALALLVVATPVSPAEAVDLIGTWHVLVHHKDSVTENPERERWEDRIWVFEREGSRLRWTDYPIVVFGDETGRFEALGGNRASRVLQFWEPNATQLAQIHEGLEINPRGSRSKALRGSDAEGWSSGKKKAGYQSARFITFEEIWQITGLPDRPTFIRNDVLGSAATEDVEGRTIYEGESVESGGDLIRGRYDRDGTRIGVQQAAFAPLEKKLFCREPSPPKLTATWSVPFTLIPYAAPAAIRCAEPTIPFMPKMPKLMSVICMEPPYPLQDPVALCVISASMSPRSPPLAIK
jgi:hypothetical protein